jgi:glycosyltransferase involved in cell wall biosynthesis
MNIVRLVDYFPPYEGVRFGLQPTFYYLSKEQAELGLKVHVICKGYPARRRTEKVDGTFVHRVTSPYNLTMLRELIKLRRRSPIHIVHTHATSGLSYSILKKAFPRKTFRIPHVAHVHGTTLGIISAFRKATRARNTITRRFEQLRSVIRETLIWRNADVVLTNSKFLKRELTALYGISDKKIHVVYNGVDTEIFYPRDSRKKITKMHGLNTEKNIILYLGGVRPVKGPLYMLKAFEKLHEENKGAQLIFIGGGYPPERKQSAIARGLIQKLQKKGVLILIENITHALLPDYYSSADVLVVPSVYDAFPKVALESIACGTPIIASSTGGIRELIEYSKMGILVKPQHTCQLAAAMVTAINDQTFKDKKQIKQARGILETSFTWKHAAKRCLRVYEKLNRER